MGNTQKPVSMSIIMSGAYASLDIVSEFGHLPPAFLPVGLSRLYERQVRFVKSFSENVILTIPSDFEPTDTDYQWLKDHGVHLVRSPKSISLAIAVQFILDVLDIYGPAAILYGDTLVELDSDFGLDQVIASNSSDYYSWASVSVDSETQKVAGVSASFGDGPSEHLAACGLFSFSRSEELRRSLNQTGDFMAAVDNYAKRMTMTAVRPRRWFDFGSFSRMMQSKHELLVSRSFNTISGDGVTLRKSSDDRSKMKAEVTWYEALPPKLRIFSPQFLGAAKDEEAPGYELEYLYYPTIAEMYVFGRLPRHVWQHILTCCLTFLQSCQDFRPSPSGEEQPTAERCAELYDALFAAKTRSRLDAFLASRGMTFDSRITVNGHKSPPFSDILEELSVMIPPTRQEHVTLMHGDFFFGNTFYDSRSRRVRVVDPRGQVIAGAPSIFGDWRYDLAKLAHSVDGLYDHILCGRIGFSANAAFELELDRPEMGVLEEVRSDFADMTLAGTPCLAPEIRAIEAMLFLSMLPLHSDDPKRQSMMLANGVLLHRELVS